MRDMAKLVGDDTSDLVGVLGFVDQAMDDLDSAPRQSDGVGVFAAHDEDTQRDRLPGRLFKLCEHLVEGRASCLLCLAAPADKPRPSTALVEYATDLCIDGSA
jgi:hypothetical protein